MTLQRGQRLVDLLQYIDMSAKFWVLLASVKLAMRLSSHKKLLKVNSLLQIYYLVRNAIMAYTLNYHGKPITNTAQLASIHYQLYSHIALLSVAVLSKKNVRISQIAEGSSFGSVIIEVYCYAEAL